MRNAKILIAEAIGTFILMMGGPGTAVLVPAFDGKLTMVALGFGFSLLIAAYAVGPISGCHINPAVTLAMTIMRKIEVAKVPAYIVGQALGAVAGGGAILAIAKGAPGGFTVAQDNFATNLYGADNGFYSFGAMVLTEILLTAVLVFVVLSTTSKKFSASQGGLAVGITLALIHFISIPVDNTSVNPIRSLGMAIFTGGESLSQLWAFIVFPLIGAVVGVLAWLAVDDAGLEDTMLGETKAAVDVRDAAARVGNTVGSKAGL